LSQRGIARTRVVVAFADAAAPQVREAARDGLDPREACELQSTPADPVVDERRVGVDDDDCKIEVAGRSGDRGP